MWNSWSSVCVDELLRIWHLTSTFKDWHPVDPPVLLFSFYRHPIVCSLGDSHRTQSLFKRRIRQNVFTLGYTTARWVTIAGKLFGWLFHPYFPIHQKSSTRRSDPNMPNLPDIGIYDEVNKLAALEVNGQWVFSYMCMYYICAHSFEQYTDSTDNNT